MQPFPHRYTVSAEGAAAGDVTVSAVDLPVLATAAPAEFGGPGDRWSPETLLAATVSDCFVLTFRAIARASKLDWDRLQCRTEGVLDRVDGVTQFTEYHIHALLEAPEGIDSVKAERLLHKAEQVCLITNSLTGKKLFSCEIRIGQAASA